MTLLVVGNRVDALTLAYRVDFDPEVIDALNERRGVTMEHGVASVYVRGLVGEMRYARVARGCWNIRNADYRVRIDLKAPGGVMLPDGMTAGWTFEVTFAAQALAQLPHVGHAVAWGRDLAESLGKVREVRLRRFDLAVDVAGWQVTDEDRKRMVKPRRGKMTSYPKVEREEDEQAFELGVVIHEQRHVTGMSVCPGGALMLRVYDKPAELAGGELDPSSKQVHEGWRWVARGWDGSAPVTRVEFQIRGQAVKEFGVLNPEMWMDPVIKAPPRDSGGHVLKIPLEEKLDSIWQRCLGWARLVVPDDARPSRCSNDPRWDLLSTVSFGEGSRVVAARRRWRLGSTPEQALGCNLSLLGARGLLPAPMRLTDISADTDREIEEDFRGAVSSVYASAADVVASHLWGRWGPKGAHDHLAEVIDAKRAYFQELERVKEAAIPHA